MKSPIGQFYKVRLGKKDISLKSFDDGISSSSFGDNGILVNSGVTFLGDHLSETTSSEPKVTSSIYPKGGGEATAVLNIGLPAYSDHGLGSNSLHTDGNAIIMGALHVQKDGTYKSNVQIDKNLTVTKNTTCNGTTYADVQGTINVQGWKGFDIKHPNKKGHRLRHICVEGPEAAIYVRGKLNGSNVIPIPDYWKGLVDPNSITVDLTPFGIYQELFVKNIDLNKGITIVNNNSGPIGCFYSVWGSRVDGEPLIVEYKGSTPAQYPGNPSQFSISGYDYGRIDNPS